MEYTAPDFPDRIKEDCRKYCYHMWLKTNNTVILILMIVFCSIIVFCSGCSSAPTISITTPAEGYNLYEMKPNDIRLTWLNHPLYSFEYPEVFKLRDYENIHGDTKDLSVSDVVFLRHESNNIFQRITVSVSKPIHGYYENAADRVKEILSIYSDKATVKNVVVSGIDATYISSPPPGPIDVENIERGVIFDYANYIWEIFVTTFFPYSEPPETEAYFNHIIETFKILD